MKALARRLMMPMGLLLLAMMLGACQTTEGFGEDVEAAGGAISDTADDASD